MKFALASHGSRGDVEPCAAVGLELLRRGHEVCMAVPPDIIGFVESAGLSAVPYGLETHAALRAYRDLWGNVFRNFWNVPVLVKLWREVWYSITASSKDVSAALRCLANGSDLLFTGLVYEDLAANVAEHHDIPLATLHFFPVRANGHLHPRVPPPLMHSAMTANEWLAWRLTKRIEDPQRRELGLPKATSTSQQRMARRRSLEIQAYDKLIFPGVAAEWATWSGRRPFVGALTMELPTDADDEVASWIAEGSPPIYFGFGSTPVESPADTFSMISAACNELGKRALLCSGWNDFSNLPQCDNVKVVPAVNFAAIFPLCRAVVHHGGAGTTAAALRAGIPMLILWSLPDQPVWAAQVKRLKCGTGRRFTRTTRETLVADLNQIFGQEYASCARRIAIRMTTPARSVTHTADLLEEWAQLRSVGGQRRGAS
jgi:UDP:flavonoid glycosyltransferase YjiC (YdhE family)